MVTIVVNGHITPNGKLEVDLPDDLPSGEVRVILEFPESEDWTEEELEELKELLTPDPKTGAEIVAGLKERGGWEDLGITSGAEWVENLRRKRREQNKW
jgi:hypothetical protein